jgi:hypothetical protein
MECEQQGMSEGVRETTSPLMETLVLGHGELYCGDYGIRCSPIALDRWVNNPYVSVDMDEDVKPTIVYDLRTIPWAFARDESYDQIIDTTGLGLSYQYQNTKFLKELQRVLKMGGTFYGRKGFTFTKSLRN